MTHFLFILEHAHAPTLNEMPGLLVVKYNRLQIILRYNIYSTGVPLSPLMSLIIVLIECLNMFSTLKAESYKEILNIFYL